jgi:hypothetical protein
MLYPGAPIKLRHRRLDTGSVAIFLGKAGCGFTLPPACQADIFGCIAEVAGLLCSAYRASVIYLTLQAVMREGCTEAASGFLTS